MEDQEFKEWEKQVENTKTHNEELLIEFQQWLESKSFKPKTVNSHIDNMRFFANEYLLRYEVIPIEKGSTEIGNYLGDYFIRKTSWASKYTIQENIAGFKKLYAFLCEYGHITNSDLEDMKELIKDEKSDWIDEVDQYWDNVEDIW